MIKILKTIPLRFYVEESGKEPVRSWLKKLSRDDRRIIGEDIKTVQLRWPLGMPLVKAMGEGIWEIRTNLKDRIARILFVKDGEYIVLLHAFIKKGQRTPLNDIELAKKRAKNCVYER